jgi:arsenite methyltransferase
LRTRSKYSTVPPPPWRGCFPSSRISLGDLEDPCASRRKWSQDVHRRNTLIADGIEFHKGYIEEIPLPDASVDVVISNCVINLSGDKPKVLREVARVLRPGGRFAVTDVIADEDMADATRADMQAYTGCIAGALTQREFTQALIDAGLADV